MTLTIVSAAAQAEAVRAAAPGTVHLADVQRVLALFAQGLSGRYLHLRPLDGEPEPGGAAGAAALYLPARMDDFDNARHNFGAYRIAVLHQLGYHENGTYAFSLRVARARLPALPAAAPGPVTAGGLTGFFALWAAPALMRRVFMTLEDLRIDTALRRRYPGARADLARVLAHALHSRQAALARGLRPHPTALLLERLVQYSLGEPRDALLAHAGVAPDAARGLLTRLLEAAADVEAEGASVYDSADAAVVCYRVLERAGLPTALSEHAPDEETMPLRDHAGAGAEPGLAALDEDALDVGAVGFRGEPNPEFMRGEPEYVTDGTLFASAEPAEDAQPEQRPPPHAVQRAARPARLRVDAGDAGSAGHEAPRSYLYDEWDYRRQTYIKGWCRLFEHRLKGEDYDFIRDVRRRHAVLVQQVRRRFKVIKPESLLRVRRVSDGEELELDGVIESVIDRRAGQATDEHVYMRRDRALRDVAAALLLDMSASTDYPLPEAPAPGAPPPADTDTDGDDELMTLWARRDDPFRFAPKPPKRRVIDVARESLSLMCEALGTVGDSHAVYGFSGSGHDNVEFHVAKSFEDRLSLRTWAALAAMKPLHSTRMGPAIRHALMRLKQQTARMKVLIIVSDGYPQDLDYGPDRLDGEYGIQDTARALKEAEEQGVEAFCVTIDPAGHDYLRRMCRENYYMVIDEVADLPRELVKVYRALTA